MAWERHSFRLLCMLSMTSAFFIIEVVVSRMTASLSMLSDSFHMLSDVIALVVALIALRFSEKTQATNENTFGWVRAEVMGALVNAVFLTALCFTIILEAIERFTAPQEIESLQVVVGVGAMGLVVNLLGLLLFHGHAGHSHSGHGHSHGGPNSLEKSQRVLRKESIEDETSRPILLDSQKTCDLRAEGYQEIPNQEKLKSDYIFLEETNKSHDVSASHLNMHGFFLHVLGDALGSVIVVVNALIFMYVWQPCQPGKTCVNQCYSSHDSDLSVHHPQLVNDTLVTMLGSSTQTSVHVVGPCWVLYLDPILCIIMAAILLYTTFPLLKESALILLQTVPKQINITRLLGRLRGLDGVLAVHDLHIWQLAGSRIIATAHVKCLDPATYMAVAKQIKCLFHDEGIHATTVQPEFVAFPSEFNIYVCELACRTQCARKLCCGSFASKTLGGPVHDKVVSTQHYSVEQPSPSIQHLHSTAIEQRPKDKMYTESSV
ncbi:hypothetical protein UPYG_G00232050 [Umbra pygmaea]|uniref:Zinc transporter 1 n=1 Tax=Umbra pygmaea TaxID=75934 RepID=A0ABD0WIM7_UMBPY